MWQEIFRACEYVPEAAGKGSGRTRRGWHAPGECARSVWAPCLRAGPVGKVDQTPASDEIQSRYSVTLT
ncbi:hypothetical protein FHU35_1754 [Saccharopolyspora dendranthemae]|uniref:Uncharacterized protein n=1 Tax=Saccharopolyspora dendranthemae TaxID=1181886 RepID=A0A561TZ90_9PSEU|nr:hypothetical protein FHU35_1754 [Saccharopolyspora dendranthemae]